MNEYFQATSSTIIRYVARISSHVFEILDEVVPDIFDTCEAETTLAQRKIEESIREVLYAFLKDLGT